MASSFSKQEWSAIFATLDKHDAALGFPKRHRKSVVLGTFNIRKIGKVAGKSAGSWEMLRRIVSRFDLIAIQEVQDDLGGIRHLKSLLGPSYGLVVSDTTGTYPGESGNTERLAFLFNWRRVKRTEVASDITYDRSHVLNGLFDNRADFQKAFADHAAWLKAHPKKTRAVPSPHFVTFIRQPLVASFEVGGGKNSEPYRFLAVAAHLLYGTSVKERTDEFYALVSWLVNRAKQAKRMYTPNILLLGDMNLDFDDPASDRPRIEAFLKSLNKAEVRGSTQAKFNFPFLDEHPTRGLFRTNARMNQTFDQIAVIYTDRRLPDHKQNASAGKNGRDGYDYGMVNFVELFARALHGKGYAELTKTEQKALLKKFEFDLTDHMPIWIRLPKP